MVLVSFSPQGGQSSRQSNKFIILIVDSFGLISKLSFKAHAGIQTPEADCALNAAGT